MVIRNGKYKLIGGWLNGLMPDPVMTVSEWADSYRKLPETNAEPGQFKTSRTPYVKEIIDKLSVTDKAQKIIWKKSSQVAATESGNNWLGYTMHISPSAMLYIMPTDTQMKLTSKTRIQKMIDATPVLREKIKSSRSRDSGNTMMTKEFMGGFVNMTGANSPVGLSSLPVQKVYCDEVDRYPADVCGEGDVISLAETRTSTFGDRRKMFITSTPTKKGESIIDKEFEKTGQRHWHVPCPHCGSYQKLVFEQLRYVKGDYLNSTKYECAHCKEQIQERFKTKMLLSGYWKPDFPEREDGITFGYHINALYSPYGWYSWAKMAQEYEEALDDLPKYIAWMNTKKGECHETEGDSPEWEAIYNKREKYNLNIPNNQVIFITAGVDIQKDRIEVEIVGWGKGKQSWSIDYRVILGNTESASNEVWTELGKIVSETWTREDGAVLPLHLMAVDSGNNTMVVYEFCRKFPVSRVIPIKGRDNMAMMVAPPKAVDTAKSGKKIDGVKVWNVGVSLIKTELYGWLKLQHIDNEEYPNGYCHFPMYDETHFKSLTAERIEYVKNKKGYTAPSWVKHYERNERLDCRVYARAAANVIGIDRLKAEDWDRLLLDTQDLVPQKQESAPASGSKKRSNFW